VGQPDTSPGAEGQAPQPQKTASAATWSDDDLFDGTPLAEVRWFAEARLLLNEALEKVLPQARGAAQRQTERQVEALARQEGLTEITAELVGLVLGGMASISVDDSP
jgi:hypothetical protein